MATNTVRIKNGDTFKVIPQRHFDPDQHEKWQDETNQDMQKMNKDSIPESQPKTSKKKKDADSSAE